MVTSVFDARRDTLERLDPVIWDIIGRKNRCQEEHIELIASENYTSPARMEAVGSQLTNKYKAGITCNKNAIPNNPQKPMITSGIRLGSSTMTTRGFGTEGACQVAHLVTKVVQTLQ